MDYKDICTKRSYESNGETKTKWFKVGTLKTTGDGLQFIELGILPDTSLYVFEQRDKSDTRSGAQDEEVPF